MNRLTRVLVVFIALASLGFAAFALALVNGGPNWEALANQPEFSRSVAVAAPQVPGGSWSATYRSSGAKIKESKNVAEVIIEGQKKILDEINTELQQLEPQIQPLQATLGEVGRVIKYDQDGIERRVQLWDAQLKQMAEVLKKMTEQLQVRTVEATQVQRDLEERRYEVLRLQNVLEILRDDLGVAKQQRDALASELVELQEAQERLERRKMQLDKQLGKNYEN